MLIETSRGPIDDSLLELRIEHSTTAAGPLRSTIYLFKGEVVKIDQQLDVSEAALAAAGLSRI
jgi:hypothetical protein